MSLKIEKARAAAATTGLNNFAKHSHTLLTPEPALAQAGISAGPTASPLADKLRVIFGAPDERQLKIRNAQASCRICAKCGRELSAAEPVWRQGISLGRGFFGGRRHPVAPVCAACRSDDREFWEPWPCENCGRPVSTQSDCRYRCHTFCCTDCERAGRVRAARQQRAKDRGTDVCLTCGQTFEPARTDAVYCSSACRQRAYRKRRSPLRLLNAYHCSTLSSRNAQSDPPDAPPLDLAAASSVEEGRP